MPELERLALFPLTSIVLFPRVRCPLHIFEPRYRQMTARALAGDRRIGMLAVRPEHLDQMPGDPPTYEIGCAGTITEHRVLPDGRFDLVLLGTRRFRIHRELEREAMQLYRVAEVEFLEDRPCSAEFPELVSVRSQVIDLAQRWVSHIAPQRAESFDPSRLASVEHEVLANALSNALPFAAAEKQGLLECAGVLERFRQLGALLSFQIAELGMGLAVDSQRVH